MNCIDAVEGTAKAIIGRLLETAAEDRLDASEFIRTIKMVLEATVAFVAENPEISDKPELMRDELYNHAKTLWLAHLEKTLDHGEEADFKPDVEYQAYCYDHVYDCGNYPR
jgi:hypothetical protein